MKAQLKFLIILTIVTIILSGYFVWKFSLDSSNKDLYKEKAELIVSVDELVNAYTNNEEKSDSLYAGKIMEVSGSIKEITFLNDRTTVILKSNTHNFGIICDINPNEKEKIPHLKQHQSVTVKGICKGFLKDVILLNCTID